MESDWEYKAGPRPVDLQNRINELVSGISADSLDIFLFGWYEFEGKTEKREKRYNNEHKRYNRRINIYNTISQERISE